MSRSKDYYSILGISRDADEKQIKSAYRKLARKYHPDVNPNNKEAEDKFKQVTEAYECLKDADKRKMYDSYGDRWQDAHAYQAQGGDMGGSRFDFGDAGSIFEDLFGGFQNTDGFGDVFQQQGRRRSRNDSPPQDINISIEVTLEEIASGTKKTIEYTALDGCNTCSGTGQVRTRRSSKCSGCGGKGVVHQFPGMNMKCSACGGSGSTNIDNCPTCRGKCTIHANRKVEVTIPKGITNGKKLRVPGRGSAGSRMKIGDLYVKVTEKSHPVFQRNGDNLEVKVPVSYIDVLLGAEIRIPTLTGSVSMKIPECTQNNQKFRLTGKGMPTLSKQVGDLYAVIQVKIPKQISDEEKNILLNLREISGVTV